MSSPEKTKQKNYPPKKHQSTKPPMDERLKRAETLRLVTKDPPDQLQEVVVGGTLVELLRGKDHTSAAGLSWTQLGEAKGLVGVLGCFGWVGSKDGVRIFPKEHFFFSSCTGRLIGTRKCNKRRSDILPKRSFLSRKKELCTQPLFKPWADPAHMCHPQIRTQ